MDDASAATPNADRLAKIQRNVDRLNGCSRHLFPSELPGIAGGVAALFGRKMKCIRCEGEADLLYINAYIRGYEASGNSGNDIMPGWRPTEQQRKFFKGPPD